MTADTLRRLQALRGLTRVGSTHTVLAAVQGDLQTVIEAVLELADENTPPASQNAPQEARSADSGTGGPPEPENATQGRIGWLQPRPDDERRHLVREAPGGWTDTAEDADPLWLRENYPNAEFEPIRTLADDEVAVKRDDLQWAVDVGRLSGPSGTMKRLRAALEAGEDRG